MFASAFENIFKLEELHKVKHTGWNFLLDLQLEFLISDKLPKTLHISKVIEMNKERTVVNFSRAANRSSCAATSFSKFWCLSRSFSTSSRFS